MVKKWRICNVLEKYIDIIHCTKQEVLSKTDAEESEELLFLYYNPNMKFWFFDLKEEKHIAKSNLSDFADIYCIVCKEKVPNYIKFQAELLVK